MRLFLLLERRYPPYGKWLGSQFVDSTEVTTRADRARRIAGAVLSDQGVAALCDGSGHVAVSSAARSGCPRSTSPKTSRSPRVRSSAGSVLAPKWPASARVWPAA